MSDDSSVELLPGPPSPKRHTRASPQRPNSNTSSPRTHSRRTPTKTTAPIEYNSHPHTHVAPLPLVVPSAVPSLVSYPCYSASQLLAEMDQNEFECEPPPPPPPPPLPTIRNTKKQHKQQYHTTLPINDIDLDTSDGGGRRTCSSLPPISPISIVASKPPDDADCTSQPPKETVTDVSEADDHNIDIVVDANDVDVHPPPHQESDPINEPPNNADEAPPAESHTVLGGQLVDEDTLSQAPHDGTLSLPMTQYQNAAQSLSLPMTQSAVHNGCEHDMSASLPLPSSSTCYDSIPMSICEVSHSQQIQMMQPNEAPPSQTIHAPQTGNADAAVPLPSNTQAELDPDRPSSLDAADLESSDDDPDAAMQIDTAPPSIEADQDDTADHHHVTESSQYVTPIAAPPSPCSPPPARPCHTAGSDFLAAIGSPISVSPATSPLPAFTPSPIVQHAYAASVPPPDSPARPHSESTVASQPIDAADGRRQAIPFGSPGSSAHLIKRCLYPQTPPKIPSAPIPPDPLRTPTRPVGLSSPAVSPPVVKRIPRSILSTSKPLVGLISSRPRPRRSVRFDLPADSLHLRVDRDDDGRPSPSKPSPTKRRARMSARARAILDRAAERERREEEEEERQRHAARQGRAGIADVEREMPDFDFSPAAAPSPAVSPRVTTSTAAAAAARPSITSPSISSLGSSTPLNSPLKPPVLPLSQIDEELDPADDDDFVPLAPRRNTQTQDAMPASPHVSRVPSVAPSSSSGVMIASSSIDLSLPLIPLPSGSCSDEYLPSQVFDDSYCNDVFGESNICAIKKDEPTKIELNTSYTAAEANNNKALHPHTHVSASSSSSSHSISVFPSPPNFVAPLPVSPSSLPFPSRIGVKHEAASSSRSPLHTSISVKAGRSPKPGPMRAPPTFLSPPIDNTHSQTNHHTPAQSAMPSVTIPTVKKSEPATVDTLTDTRRGMHNPITRDQHQPYHHHQQHTLKHHDEKRSHGVKRSAGESVAVPPAAIATDGDSDLNEFAPPDILTSALNSIKRESTLKTSTRIKSERVIGATCVTSTAPAVSVSSESGPEAATVISHKYKRPRLHKQAVPSVELDPAPSRDVRRVINGVVSISVGCFGIDNRIVDQRDGQEIEEIEEFGEEEEEEGEKDGTKKKKHTSKDGKGKSKKRLRAERDAKAQRDKRQRCITDSMVAKTESSVTTLASAVAPVTAPPVASPSRTPVAASIPAAAESNSHDSDSDAPIEHTHKVVDNDRSTAPSTNDKSSKKLTKVDPRQTLLNGFFTPKVNGVASGVGVSGVNVCVPFVANLSRCERSDSPTSATSASSSSSNEGITRTTPIKRTYATKDRKKEQEIRQTKSKAIHDTIDLVGDDDGDDDDDDGDGGAAAVVSNPVIAPAASRLLTPSRSASDPTGRGQYHQTHHRPIQMITTHNDNNRNEHVATTTIVEKKKRKSTTIGVVMTKKKAKNHHRINEPSHDQRSIDTDLQHPFDESQVF